MNVDYVTLHCRSVLNDFSNQFLNEEFSDCVLNAEGRSLKVHKAMLCAQSSFLEVSVLFIGITVIFASIRIDLYAMFCLTENDPGTSEYRRLMFHHRRSIVRRFKISGAIHVQWVCQII